MMRTNPGNQENRVTQVVDKDGMYVVVTTGDGFGFESMKLWGPFMERVEAEEWADEWVYDQEQKYIVVFVRLAI